MNPDTSDINQDNSEFPYLRENSKLMRKARVRRKIEQYKEDKKLRQNLYDVFDDATHSNITK